MTEDEVSEAKRKADMDDKMKVMIREILFYVMLLCFLLVVINGHHPPPKDLYCVGWGVSLY